MKLRTLALLISIFICVFYAQSQNPFTEIGKEDEAIVLTLSDGRYVEFFENDTLRQIGSVMFNMVTNKIEYIIPEDDLEKIRIARRDKEVSRFMSLDPLAKKYPWNSPYAFSENVVINAVELEGLEKEIIIDKWYNLDGKDKSRPVGDHPWKPSPYKPKLNPNGVPVINSTSEALDHYFRGNGIDVVLGNDVIKDLKNNKRVKEAINNIESGTTSMPSEPTGVLKVDMTFDGQFFIGRIGLTYSTFCQGEDCETTYTLDDDGFVDANYLSPAKNDGAGPNRELKNGKTYDFAPVTWKRKFKNPGYDIDDNGRPKPIQLKDEKSE